MSAASWVCCARVRRFGSCLACAIAVLSFGGSVAVSHAAAVPVRYLCNVAITMPDGTVLRANVAVPAGAGRYPTILTATIYGKDSPVFATAGAALGAGGPEPPPGTCQVSAGSQGMLADQGYAVMVVDVRGTGESGGYDDDFGSQATQDLEDVLDWIQAQPWSDGSVGATGCSALGVTTTEIAQADLLRVQSGEPRAVKAIWAGATMPDLYHDAIGGPGGGGTSLLFPAVIGLVAAGKYTTLAPGELTASQMVPFATSLLSSGMFTRSTIDFQTNGPLAFDGTYWQQRDMDTLAPKITIPVALNATFNDAVNIQAGVSDYFDRLTSSRDRVMFYSPGIHCAAGNYSQLGFGQTWEDMAAAWFNHWLKGVPNGINRLPAVNFLPANDNHWIQSKTYPITGTQYQKFYLGGGGALSTTVPASASQQSFLALPARPNGRFDIGLGGVGVPLSGPLSYTTAPLAHTTTIAGMITADIYASFNRPQGLLDVRVEDVAPNGSVTDVTGGAGGYIRATDRAVTGGIHLPGGITLAPVHPDTQAAQLPINGANEYQIEVSPTGYIFGAGHRIRLTISNTDWNWMQSLYITTQSLGGTDTILDGGTATPSNIALPIITCGPGSETDIATCPTGHATAPPCTATRKVSVKIPPGLKQIRVTVAGKRHHATVRKGRLTLSLRGAAGRRVRVVIRGKTARGKRYVHHLTLNPCHV